MEISENGLNFIAAHEGYSDKAYPDVVGVLTIGHGHTQGVKEGETCNRAQALLWLHADCQTAVDCLSHHVSVPLNQNQFDALCSFVFNLGCGALQSSALLRLLNAGDYNGAANQFKRWCYAGGKIVDGLKKRRDDEAALFSRVEGSNAQAV